ncbi:MAG: NAD-dependent epimerase/dehydratase family protein [Acidimicrobiia bacterium]|nr:NAD-dependent epimerase/dehydratase family protein [Acidimicrobiia bacterium]
MPLRSRLTAAVALLVSIAALGTVAYMWLEDMTLLDAFYFTVITISTVGFSEPAGGFTPGGEFATIILIVIGVGTVFYTATIGLEFTMEQFLGGTMQTRLEKRRVARMQGHVIICGYGRVGRHVWEVLESGGLDVVVVDSDARHAQQARDSGLAVIEADATDDAVLDEAGIDRAAVLIASVRTDPDNVAIVLSARAKRSSLRIVARANEPQAERKLLLAGADRVVMPAVVGAERMATMIGQPNLADFIDLPFRGGLVELRVEELALTPASPLAGRTLAESGIRAASGAMLIAIIPVEGEPTLNPPADFVLRPGQRLAAVGTEEQLGRLREHLKGS